MTYLWRTCDLPFSSERAVKIHLGKYHKPSKTQDFSHRLADAAVKRRKLELQQQERQTIICGEEILENVFNFVYLGSVFSADSSQWYDIKRRVAMAMTRSGKLRHIFDSDNISLQLKLRLHRAAVCSVLIYGCESWLMSDRIMRRLNHVNSLMLSRISGKSPRQEARPTTTNFDLIRRIRIIRYKYLGCVLRGKVNCLAFTAATIQFNWGINGTLFDDVPQHNSLQHLRDLAMDKAGWNAHIGALWKSLTFVRGDSTFAANEGGIYRMGWCGGWTQVSWMIWRVDTGKLDDTRGGRHPLWKGGDRWMIVTQCECGGRIFLKWWYLMTERNIFYICGRVKYHNLDFWSCFRSDILRRSHRTGRLNASIPIDWNLGCGILHRSHRTGRLNVSMPIYWNFCDSRWN